MTEYRASVGEPELEVDPICITCRCPQSVHRPSFARDSAKPLSLEPARWICPEPPCSSAIRSSKGWRKSAVLEGVEGKCKKALRKMQSILNMSDEEFEAKFDLDGNERAGLGEGREGEQWRELAERGVLALHSAEHSVDFSDCQKGTCVTLRKLRTARSEIVGQ